MDELAASNPKDGLARVHRNINKRQKSLARKQSCSPPPAETKARTSAIPKTKAPSQKSSSAIKKEATVKKEPAGKAVGKRKRSDDHKEESDEEDQNDDTGDEKNEDGLEDVKPKAKGRTGIKKEHEVTKRPPKMKVEKQESDEEYVKDEIDEGDEEAVKKHGKKWKKTSEDVEVVLSEKDKYLLEFPIIKCRTVPTSFFAAIRDSQVDIDNFLESIGFYAFRSIKIDNLPGRLGRFAVRAFKKESYQFELLNGSSFLVTPQKIKDILGLPIGGTSIYDLPERALDDPFVLLWLRQFGKPWKKVRASDIQEKLNEAEEVDFMFKVNFLTLFSIGMCTAYTMIAIPDLTVVRRIREDTDISGIDWCEFVYRCLGNSTEPNTLAGFYIGPLCFLILLYLDSTKFDRYPVLRSRPAILNWNSTNMHRRQDLEVKEKVIGKLELQPEWIASKEKQTEGFFDVCKQTKGFSDVAVAGKQVFCTKIEEKLSSIAKDKVELECILRDANKEFPNDENIRQLIEKYEGVFKDTVLLQDERTHIDDFSVSPDENVDLNKATESAPKEPMNTVVNNAAAVNEDSEADVNEEDVETYTQWLERNIHWVGEEDLFNMIGNEPNVSPPKTPQRVSTRSSPKKKVVKPSSVLCSPFMNKKIQVTPNLVRLEFVLGNSLFAMQGDKYETVFQTNSGYEQSSVRVSMETLAPGLWLDHNVIDCWSALLNMEERDALLNMVEAGNVNQQLRRHFLTTGCIPEGIIKNALDVEAQWKVFSDAISAHFQHDEDALRLSHVDLLFFPICASGHFYVVVFNFVNPSMFIIDNIHSGPNCYSSRYKAACDPLKKFFLRHLKEHSHDRLSAMMKVKPRILHLKWSTKNNYEDCGIFTMIHMESYTGAPVADWDVGFGVESKEQRSKLLHMRYRIATKLLLHDFNIHKQKMFELAFKFETENEEQKRVAIIHDAIKNRDERDPPKTMPGKEDPAEGKEVAKDVKAAKQEAVKQAQKPKDFHKTYGGKSRK